MRLLLTHGRFHERPRRPTRSRPRDSKCSSSEDDTSRSLERNLGKRKDHTILTIKNRNRNGNIVTHSDRKYERTKWGDWGHCENLFMVVFQSDSGVRALWETCTRDDYLVSYKTDQWWTSNYLVKHFKFRKNHSFVSQGKMIPVHHWRVKVAVHHIHVMKCRWCFSTGFSG